MFKYKVFFTLDESKMIHGVEFIVGKQVSDAYIYLFIRDVVKGRIPENPDVEINIKRTVCVPLNEVFITDIY